ncbi:MAG: (2Fe-2S)-binding protein [Deltaproteobacteria bacterium]|jgi:predicted molibdopterin-dependent oxidoreductase YjgC|nr:(2Fe-2S)-binding protein [Deltaproteobacteria bacterium]
MPNLVSSHKPSGQSQTGSQGLVEFVLNGVTVEGFSDQTVMEAAAHYVRIPCLCQDDVIPPGELCGLCLVEIADRNDLVCASQTFLEPGLEIMTFSREVRRARLAALKKIAQNHRGDCLTCDRSGHCNLQTLCHELNLASAFLPKSPSDLKLVKRPGLLSPEPMATPCPDLSLVRFKSRVKSVLVQNNYTQLHNMFKSIT